MEYSLWQFVLAVSVPIFIWTFPALINAIVNLLTFMNK